MLANTEELHNQIDTMSSRIRQLERGLRDLQATVSTEPHSLLVNDLILPSPSLVASTPPPPLQRLSPLASTSKSDRRSQEQEQSQQSKSGSASRVVSGPHPMQVDAAEDVVDACGTHNVPVGINEKLTGIHGDRDIDFYFEWWISTFREHCASRGMRPWHCFRLFLIWLFTVLDAGKGRPYTRLTRSHLSERYRLKFALLSIFLLHRVCQNTSSTRRFSTLIYKDWMSILARRYSVISLRYQVQTRCAKYI